MKRIIIITVLFFAFAANVQAQQTDREKATPSTEVNSNEVKYNKLMQKGRENINEGNFEEAIRTFTDAMAYNIEPQKAQYYRAFSYYMGMKYDRALKDLNAVIETGKEAVPQAYFIRGTIKLALDDTEGACADLKKAKELGHDVNLESYVEICG